MAWKWIGTIEEYAEIYIKMSQDNSEPYVELIGRLQEALKYKWKIMLLGKLLKSLWFLKMQMKLAGNCAAHQGDRRDNGLP